MTHTRAGTGQTEGRADLWQQLRELDMFFQGRDPVHKTMRRLVKRLDKANIPYAIVGGMAVFFHDHRRATDGVDVLLTREGLEEFQKRFVGKYYERMAGRGRRFVDRASQEKLDVLVTGLFPGSGKPGPIAYPNPADVREEIDELQMVNLRTLIELKLAARRYQDPAPAHHPASRGSCALNQLRFVYRDSGSRPGRPPNF